MAAHGADAHAQTVDGNAARGTEGRIAENLVAFRPPLPFFLGLAFRHRHVDPGDQAAGQGGVAEVFLGQGIGANGGGHLAVDVQNGGGRIGQLIRHGGVDVAHLGDQFPHVLGTGAGGGLIGHGRHPLHQPVLEKAAQAHEHEGHGAVAANPVLAALGQGVQDHRLIHRIENDHRVFRHAQGGGGVDPVTLPARGPQLGENFLGVIAPLAGDDNVHGLQGRDGLGVLQGQSGFFAAEGRRLATSVGRGEIDRFDGGEVPFFHHALHQHGTHHATPTYQTDSLHVQPRKTEKLRPGSPDVKGAPDGLPRRQATREGELTGRPAPRHPFPGCPLSGSPLRTGRRCDNPGPAPASPPLPPCWRLLPD